MSKFATKAAANMFCQARYEAAKSNERLSSREGATEEIGIDRTSLPVVLNILCTPLIHLEIPTAHHAEVGEIVLKYLDPLGI